jgi:hypothetical protein
MAKLQRVSLRTGVEMVRSRQFKLQQKRRAALQQPVCDLAAIADLRFFPME